MWTETEFPGGAKNQTVRLKRRFEERFLKRNGPRLANAGELKVRPPSFPSGNTGGLNITAQCAGFHKGGFHG
jgi:hypothetical protein